MNWQQAIEITKPAIRVQWLCSDENHNIEQRDGYRRLMVEMASGNPVAYPSTLNMAGNAIEAAKRIVSAWWKGEPTMVGADEVARRIAICLECEKYDPKQRRCTLCGCFAKWKTRLATEHCPIPESEGGPKW